MSEPVKASGTVGGYLSFSRWIQFASTSPTQLNNLATAKLIDDWLRAKVR
jgi:hypothetical protein